MKHKHKDHTKEANFYLNKVKKTITTRLTPGVRMFRRDFTVQRAGRMYMFDIWVPTGVMVDSLNGFKVLSKNLAIQHRSYHDTCLFFEGIRQDQFFYNEYISFD